MCKDSSRRLISLIEHHAILLAWLSFWIASTEVTGDKIRCSIPPVVPFEDTVLTCSFPEDVNATKKDFTFYHYVEHSSPDAVLDCWWIRGSLDCFVKEGFRYNKMVNTSLNMTVASVTSAYTGRYACQAAGYGSSSLETCDLKFKYGKENTCRIKVSSDTLGTPAYLACLFNEDVQKTHRNFTVYEYIGESRLGVVECWWEVLGRPQCRTEDGYRLHDDMSSFIKVELPNRRKEAAVSYSCWHAGSIADHQERCFLPKKTVTSPEDRVLNIALGVGLSVGLLTVVSLVLLLVKCRRRRKRHVFRKQDTSAGDEGGQPLVETKMKKQTTAEITKQFQHFLAQKVIATYPNTYDEFYFVPPLYFNKTRCKKQSVGGDFVFVLDPSDPRDVRHDRAMQHVMHCLRHVAEQGHEPMFVLTQFQYKDYLNNPGPEYKRHCLPMPAGLKGGDKHVGCLDFLIVHREHGLLVGVVTAVSEQDVEGEDDEHKKYEAVVAQVTEAVKQLRKAERMIKHLLSDHKQVFTVRHTLVLPNLTTSSLRSAVASNSTLVEDLPESIRSDPSSDPSELCLCADDMSDASTPWDVSSDAVNNIRRKWKWSDASKSTMSEGFYLTMLARFFGPATRSTLKVPEKYERFILPKTLAEAVSLTGEFYGLSIIDPPDLLNKPQVLLFGPSESDKTRMLTLAGRKWLSNGHSIFIVTASNSDRFVLQSLVDLATQNTPSTAEPKCERVFHQECDFTSQASIENSILEVIEKKEAKQLCILLYASHIEKESVKVFSEILLNKAPDVYLWVSCLHGDVCPRIPVGKMVTEVLNCPPAVLREANPSKAAHKADDVVYPSLTDGPPVKHFHHQHTRRFSWFRRSCECLECGQKVGTFLTNTLLISTTEPTTNSPVGQTADYPLKCKDILIVFEIGKDIREDNFLEGLRMSGVKVQAIKVEKDTVAAADDGDSALAMSVRHMETYRTKRKVIVYVQADSECRDLENKRRALTSCTAQLILVRSP